MEFHHSLLTAQAIESQRGSNQRDPQEEQADVMLRAIFPEWVGFIDQKGKITSGRNLGLVSWEKRIVEASIGGAEETPITATATLMRSRLLLKGFAVVLLKIRGLSEHLEMGQGWDWDAKILGEKSPLGARDRIEVRYPNLDDVTFYSALLNDFRREL